MEFLCIDFINSHWYTTHKPFEERLENAAWLEGFRQKWGLPAVDVSDENIAALRDLRTFLLGAARELCAGSLSPEKQERLNGYLKTASVHPMIEVEAASYRLRLKELFSSPGIAVVLYRITLSFAELMTGYPTDRFKQCGNPACGWFFYDDTKSRTKKWCDKTCASLMKVRKHRAWKKAVMA